MFVFPLKIKNNKTILALGAELKSSFCLVQGENIFFSEPFGDLKEWENYEKFQKFASETIQKFKPVLIVHDLHPNYFSTKFAYETKIKTFAVQHHKAHIASVTAENFCNSEVIGIALDGTGFGEDGTIWGGEFFAGKIENLQRAGSFKPISLAGGDKAVSEIWRVGLALLKEAKIDFRGFFSETGEKEKDFVSKMLEKKINCFQTSSCGRLFDGISSILGVCQKANFEAEGAILLESIASKTETKSYNFEILNSNSFLQLDFTTTIQEIVSELKKASKETISAKFHNTLAGGIFAVAEKISQETGIKIVALSGGCFQNQFLTSKLNSLLGKKYQVLNHKKVPANDNGIAFGQVVSGIKKAFQVELERL
ncbi:carbamoyltransferase HypF [bacterium]|nr:carbamoyltransferase HypF [bacterium]